MYYKSTKIDCENYNALVTEGENYSGTTTHWANPKEVDSVWYIVKNSKYLSEMEEVEFIPIINENLI